MSTADLSTGNFDPTNVNLSTADPRDVICALSASGNEYNGQLGARISALFVIMIVSTCATFFPVIAKRIPRLRIPVYVYLFARYFGAGDIVATAFNPHLAPAYSEIGPATCVGMTGNWAQYSWCPAIVLTSVMFIFLLDFGAERYVETKYGLSADQDIQGAITEVENDKEADIPRSASHVDVPHDRLDFHSELEEGATPAGRAAFRQQIAAFLILEFGVIFHSVIIGLNLGVAGDEFSTLYVVLVFYSVLSCVQILTSARSSTNPSKASASAPACPPSPSHLAPSSPGSSAPHTG